MPFGLRHVISRILAGGFLVSAWCCVAPSPACMALYVFVFPFLCLVSCLCLAILGCDDTMLPSPA